MRAEIQTEHFLPVRNVPPPHTWFSAEFCLEPKKTKKKAFLKAKVMDKPWRYRNMISSVFLNLNNGLL